MRKVAALAAAGGAAWAVGRYLAFRQALSTVAPELRNPILPYVTVPYTAKTLPIIRLLYRLKTSPGPGVQVQTHRVGEPALRVVVTSPEHRTRACPVVLMLHAGGMIVGSPDLELRMAGRLARELGAVIVSPDYRLAPEHPFPASLDDCMTTLQWMRDCDQELGIDGDRIAVAGFSAGGGLAAAVAQRSRDEGIPLRAQGLVYPMLDDRSVWSTDHHGRGQLVWTPASNRFAWTAYLGREPRMSDAPPPYAAPARREDVSGLAPAWIGVGELDLFYSESVHYAGTLRDSGVPCELVTVPGMYHAADGYAPKAPSMQRFVASLVEHLRRNL